jgi:hypothetical protein
MNLPASDAFWLIAAWAAFFFAVCVCLLFAYKALEE